MTWKDNFKNYALENASNEMCGLLAIIEGEKQFYPCKNLADEKNDFFVLDPDDWADCEDKGEIIGVVHSHPIGAATASDADMAACEHLGFPYYIYSIQYDDWFSLNPSGWKTNSLIGRRFIFGIFDCWSLITDWFLENKNIDIAYTKRPNTLKEFVKNPLCEQTLPNLGFKEVDDKSEIKVGDVLLMESVKNSLAHAALYIGDSTILHHSMGKLSCREPYDLNYQQATKKIYRYDS